MNTQAVYEPDAWDLWCRRQWESAPKMLDLLTTRSDAAKKASEEEAASDKKRLQAVNAATSEKMRVRAAVIKQLYEAECAATRDWIDAQEGHEMVAPFDTIDFTSKEAAGGLFPRGDQKVVPLKRSAQINAVPQPTYVSLPWSDAVTENMEYIDRISRALEEENAGKRSKRHENLLLRKYFEALGSPRTASVGRTGYPEHLEKRVNRYLWLEHAFETGKVIYPKGYPLPLTEDEQQALQKKLRAAGVPRDGIQQLISSLRKLLKRDSRRPRTH